MRARIHRPAVAVRQHRPAVTRRSPRPVRRTGAAFFALLGVAAAEASQAIGALLLLGLIAAPAGAAHVLTARPWRALALSGLFALAAIWIGVAVAYAAPETPVSFVIMATLTAEYLTCGAVHRLARRTARPDPAGHWQAQLAAEATR